jgi:hypothetical protein
MADEQEFHKQPTIQAPPSSIPSAPINPPIPDFIGPYKIETLMEMGGMNVIYLGIHPETKEPTTIKVLLPKFQSHPDVVQRFINEAEIIAMTDHPNIVKLYGHGEWEKGLYIAMEFIQGVSLRHTLLQNPISLKRALEIVTDIAYALCHLHTHGVIHRDLKPENILITEEGQAKVIDFGIAQLLTEKGSKDSPAKQRLIGTPIYMSPEQQENPEIVSYPSDIYSLGIITYELVLGKLSHGHIHLSLMPKGLQKILGKALQPNPKDRYQDVVDYITDITNYLNSTDINVERKIGDRISELSEDLRSAQDFMTPQKPTDWSKIEVGKASHQGMGILGVYYDFVHLMDGNYGVIIAESSARGAESIIFLAMLRGIIQTLINQTTDPIELATRLNKIILDQHIEQIFAFNFLILNPNTDSFELLSCGYGNLWHIAKGVPKQVVSNNLALGIEKDPKFNIITETWEKNDTLVLTSFPTSFNRDSEEVTFSSEFIQQILSENANESPQKIADALLRKAKASSKKNSPGKTITILSLRKI